MKAFMKKILKTLKKNRNYLISLGLSILAAFLLGALLMLVTGYDPMKGYAAMLKGAFGSSRVFGNTLAKGVREAVQEQGILGALTGGLKASAAGIAAAVFFGFLAALVCSPKDKS